MLHIGNCFVNLSLYGQCLSVVFNREHERDITPLFRWLYSRAKRWLIVAVHFTPLLLGEVVLASYSCIRIAFRTATSISSHGFAVCLALTSNWFRKSTSICRSSGLITFMSSPKSLESMFSIVFVPTFLVCNTNVSVTFSTQQLLHRTFQTHVVYHSSVAFDSCQHLSRTVKTLVSQEQALSYYGLRIGRYILFL